MRIAWRRLISLYQVKGQRNYGSQKNFGTDLEKFRLAYGTLRERLEEVYDLEHELEPEDDAFIADASLFLFNLKVMFTSFDEAVARAKREHNALDFDDILLAVRRSPGRVRGCASHPGRALQIHPGGRVPGHGQGAGGHHQIAARRRSGQTVRGGGRQAVHLPVPPGRRLAVQGDAGLHPGRALRRNGGSGREP